MCLAIPIRLKEINGSNGMVEMSGIRRRVNLSLLENPKVGDYVMVHAGFAISIVDEEAAEETLDLLRKVIGQEEGGEG